MIYFMFFTTKSQLLEVEENRRSIFNLFEIDLISEPFYSSGAGMVWKKKKRNYKNIRYDLSYNF
jgi:hypothetical protein